MSDPNIIIGRLPDIRWKKGRDLRLEALKIEPTAFSSTYDEELNTSKEEWIVRNRNALYAFDNNELVRMIVIVIQEYEMTKHIANIFGVYVKKTHRRMGVGSKLMLHAIQKLRENGQLTKIKLTVNTEQIAAISLYEKLGFVKVGIQKKEFYFNGRFYDNLLMELHF